MKLLCLVITAFLMFAAIPVRAAVSDDSETLPVLASFESQPSDASAAPAPIVEKQ